MRGHIQDDPARKLSAKLYDIPLLCLQWKTPDDGQRNCPKHVEFHFKNKFDKLVHLVGFIVRNSSALYMKPLHVHLTISTSKGFIEHYGFMERVRKFKFKCKKGPFVFPHTSNKKCVLPGIIVCFVYCQGRLRWPHGLRRALMARCLLRLSYRVSVFVCVCVCVCVWERERERERERSDTTINLYCYSE